MMHAIGCITSGSKVHVQSMHAGKQDIAMCNLLLVPAALWHQANPLCNMGTLVCTLHHEQCQQMLPAESCLEQTT